MRQIDPKKREGVIRAFKCTMINKVTGDDKTYVVYCENIDLVEGQWHEVHEQETEIFEDHDTPKHWQFKYCIDTGPHADGRLPVARSRHKICREKG